MSGTDVEVVLVEDNPTDAELIVRVLKKNDLADKLILLKDGAEALDFFLGLGTSVRTPKVVLLDLKLPKVDGIEVLRRIKTSERTRMIPVVILTSSSEDRDLQAAYDLGANSYVSKPIKFDEFAKVVADMGHYWLALNKLSNR